MKRNDLKNISLTLMVLPMLCMSIGTYALGALDNEQDRLLSTLCVVLDRVYDDNEQTLTHHEKQELLSLVSRAARDDVWTVGSGGCGIDNEQCCYLLANTLQEIKSLIGAPAVDCCGNPLSIIDCADVDCAELKTLFELLLCICQNIGSGENTSLVDQIVTQVCECARTAAGSTIDVLESVIEETESTLLNELSVIESIVSAIDLEVDLSGICSCVDAAAHETQDFVCSCVDTLSEGACSIIAVTEPMTISQAGRYCLQSNITGTITIAASSVALDLSGHSITSGGAACIVVSGTIRDIHVKNGLLDGNSVPSSIGISQVGGTATGLFIEDVVVIRCNSDGINLGTTNGLYMHNDEVSNGASAGIRIGASTDVFIDEVICFNNNAGGIICTGTSGIIMDHVETRRNTGGSGIFLSGVQDVIIRNTISATNSVSYGLRVEGTSRKVRLQGSLFDSNDLGGISVSASDDIHVINCSMSNNTGSAGFSALNSNVNCVSCIASSNNGAGFLATTSSGNRGAVITKCIANNNNGAGFSWSGASPTIILSVVAAGCIAKSNGAGFVSGNDSLGEVRGCTADDNLTEGFYRDPSTSTVRFYSNTACNNAQNYQNITDAPVTSAANARGVYNVDCTNSTPDQVGVLIANLASCCEQINSRLDVIEGELP